MQRKALDSSKIKILVCCHKPCELPKDDIFLPIQVGAAISDVDLRMQRDDKVNGETCDNISAKNKSFCELTAMYWAWKNIKKLYPKLEYIGLCHYRRCFNLNGNRKIPYYIKKDVFSDFSEFKLSKLLKNNYSILSTKNCYPFGLDVDYCYHHIGTDYYKLKEVVTEIYPDYANTFVNVMEQNNKMSQYNMFVLKIKDFENYCEWLFSILFELEKRLDISNYSDVQKRIFGFMAERLLNVYVTKDLKKIAYVPINWDIEKLNASYLKIRLSELKQNIIFKLYKFH